MAKENIAVLIEAKTEYNKYLVGIFKDNIIATLKKLYSDAENLCMQENTPENILMVFQDFLSKINKWSATKLNQEFAGLKQKTGCDWIDDLIKVIYVTNVKIMTMTNKIKKDAQIQVKVPTGGQFYHLCILEVARQVWRSPYLFVKQVGTVEYQKNMREVDKLASDSILEVLRVQMPVKNIIMDYIETEPGLTPDKEPDAPAILSKSVIKEVVKKDLARLNNPVAEPPRVEPPKSKLAKLLETPAKQMTRSKDPLTDLIDIDEKKPTTPNKTYLKQLFKSRVIPAIPKHEVPNSKPVMLDEVPEPKPVIELKEDKIQAPVTLDKVEPVMLDVMTDSKPAVEPDPLAKVEPDMLDEVPEPKPVIEPEEDKIQAPVTQANVEPVMLDELPDSKSAVEPEEDKIQAPVTLDNVEPVMLDELTDFKSVEPVMLDEVPGPKPVVEPASVPVVESASAEKIITPAPKNNIHHPASNKLSSLLAPDELADLDFELEELNIDDIIEEQKVMKPIKVKKAAPFVFFKNAPSYPGN